MNSGPTVSPHVILCSYVTHLAVSNCCAYNYNPAYQAHKFQLHVLFVGLLLGSRIDEGTECAAGLYDVQYVVCSAAAVNRDGMARELQSVRHRP